MYVPTGIPTSISYSYDYPSYCMSNHDSSEFSKQSDLKVFNTTCTQKDSYNYLTGELTNNSSVKMEFVEVRVYYKKGNQVWASESSTLSNLRPGQTTSFSIYDFDAPTSYDSYVIIATQH